MRLGTLMTRYDLMEARRVNFEQILNLFQFDLITLLLSDSLQFLVNCSNNDHIIYTHVGEGSDFVQCSKG